MSSTRRGGKRSPSDNYPTPAFCVHRLLDRVPLVGDGIWYEPCAGEGAIIRAVESWRSGRLEGIDWYANELRSEAVPTLEKVVPRERITVGDYRDILFPPLTNAIGLERPWDEAAPNSQDVSVVITNPPFRLAMDVINQSLTSFPHASLVLLLRLNFLGSEDRQPFHRDFAPDVYVLPNRPSFRPSARGKHSTDSPEYAWFCWGPSPRRRAVGEYQILDTTPLEERR